MNGPASSRASPLSQGNAFQMWEQVKLLERVLAEAGEAAVNGWLAVNLALGNSQTVLD